MRGRIELNRATRQLSVPDRNLALRTSERSGELVTVEPKAATSHRLNRGGRGAELPLLCAQLFSRSGRSVFGCSKWDGELSPQFGRGLSHPPVGLLR